MPSKEQLGTALKGRQARMNVHTSDVERLLDPKIPIVSKTDLKGKITYVNPTFVTISGFTEEELLGQPHNMVRHPDMPRDAFKDLWDTVRQDVPWQGLVKNRCKDGSYYWVHAYVTPLTENGKKVGYMSVRSKPTEEQKRGAEALYKQINAGSTPFPFTKVNRGRPVAVDLGISVLLPVVLMGVGLAAMQAVPWLGWLCAGLGVLAAGAGFAWVRGQITNSSEALLRVLHALSEGDFKQEIAPCAVRELNSVHTALRSMQVNLRAIIADVILGASEVKGNAEKLSELAMNLMGRSHQQSDGINSVASALEELSVSVHEISEATNKSSAHAKLAMDVVDQGSDCMNKSTVATNKVTEVVQDAKYNIEELNNAVLKISNVTRTITEIAEKTNLLALNAAIEAARAGESGRGFAVVADEVRKLAEMTRQSTTEIASTVREVQEGTAKGLTTMQRAVEEVDTSTELINEAGNSLQSIREASRGVAQSAREISAMLEQQSQASLEVANSMERMSSLTESNLAAIEDLDGAAKTLAQTSGSLRSLVKHFEASL